MRCGCPNCGAFMIHSDRDNACVCPDCLYRCYACQGTDSVLPREAVLAMKGRAPASMEERFRKEQRQEQDGANQDEEE